MLKAISLDSMFSTMHKILCPLDAFGDKALQLKIFDTLKAFGHGAEIQIEPVTVLSPDQLRVPATAFHHHREEYRLEAEKILLGWTKKTKSVNITKPTLLVSERFSTKASVTTLLSYAKQTGASAIAVSTRASKGLTRILLGSFAETLLLHSTVPLLISNPKTIAPKKFQHVIFTTDLSMSSLDSFKQVRDVAKMLNAKLIIYHKLEYVIPETVMALHDSPVYDKYLADDIKDRERRLTSLVDEATSSGIKTTLMFDKRPGFVVDAIVKLSKKLKSSLICMSSHTGPVASALLGSVARQVVRDTKSACWVVHTASK